MGYDAKPSPLAASQPVRFRCGACGTVLTLSESKAAASGPCPRCGTWIDATLFRPHEAPRPAPIPALPVAPAVAENRNPPAPKAVRSRIRADGFLDHEYNERRELYKTLKVLAFFVAVGAVVFIVTVFMHTWMRK